MFYSSLQKLNCHYNVGSLSILTVLVCQVFQRTYLAPGGAYDVPANSISTSTTGRLQVLCRPRLRAVQGGARRLCIEISGNASLENPGLCRACFQFYVCCLPGSALAGSQTSDVSSHA